VYDIGACGDALVGAAENAGACNTLSRGRNRHDLQPDTCSRHRRRPTRGTMSRSPCAGRTCIIIKAIIMIWNSMDLFFYGCLVRFRRGEIRRAVWFLAQTSTTGCARILHVYNTHYTGIYYLSVSVPTYPTRRIRKCLYPGPRAMWVRRESAAAGRFSTAAVRPSSDLRPPGRYGTSPAHIRLTVVQAWPYRHIGGLQHSYTFQ